MPPLRERPDDVIEFANYFLAVGNKELNRNVKGFDSEVLEIFKNYAWYGNLRELKNIVKRSVLLCPNEYIAADILPEEIKKNSFISVPVGSENAGLKGASIEAEKEAIMDALEKSKFNKSKAAELLNVDRKTLYNKIRQYNIEV